MMHSFKNISRKMPLLFILSTLCIIVSFILSCYCPSVFNSIIGTFELIYYIGFIILTAFLVFYAQQTLKIQKKPATLLARVNFNLDGKRYIVGYGVPVTVDIYNAGDEPIENVRICFVINGIEGNDIINFIAPHEDYDYCIGYIEKEEIRWIIDNKKTYTTKMSRYQMPEQFELEVTGNEIKAIFQERPDDANNSDE